MDRWNVLIAVHAVAAAYAMVFGAVQLIRRRKGDRPHRWIGWVWVAAMAIVVTSSFWIQTDGGFTWLHGLSLWTAFSLLMAISAARRHDVRGHAIWMTGTYLGLWGAFIGVVVVASRRIPTLAREEPWVLAVWVGLIVASAACGVLAVFRGASTRQHPPAR